MSTTTATTSAPKPVESSAKPAQANARKPGSTEGEDMFANLLSLLASTQVLPEAATLASVAPGEAVAADLQKPDNTDNPFAALVGWSLPGLGKDFSGTTARTDTAGLPGAPSLSDRTVEPAGKGQIDISGMTPVESTPLEIAPKGQVALHANAARPGVPPLASKGADAVSLATSSPNGTAWRHASLATTETSALQQATHPSAQVRSTVALNDRFGLAPGVPLATTEQREAGAEVLSVGNGAGSRAADAPTAVTGTTAGDSSMGSDNTGSDASAFDQTDGQTRNPYADANATEEPTVTHWGTQHLRHASLRVDGEAGEQAIDIQLSMKGQEVQVEFKTDSAEARASLRENAGESLGDLLNKSGMQLGGVSVGSHGQPGSRGEGESHRQNGFRALASSQEAALPPATAAKPAARSDGSQPLDVFA